jgi:RNA polymerase sigma-70 factor (ECF subfamily)
MLDGFEQARSRLFGLAYRMLGSVMEADDVLQDAFLRYQAADRDQIRSEGAFLTTMVTRLCLDRLKAAHAQREQYIGEWLPEPLPTPDLDTLDPAAEAEQAESLSIAFLLLLEHLTPEARAVFVLHEVFDHTHDEIAAVLHKSAAACRQLLSRARKQIAGSRPPPVPPDATLLPRLAMAMQSGDLGQLLALLSDGVVIHSDGGGKVKAARQPIIGKNRVAQFLVGLLRLVKPDEQLEVGRMNGTPCVLVREVNGVVNTVGIVEGVAGAISAIYFMRNPDKLRHL